MKTYRIPVGLTILLVVFTLLTSCVKDIKERFNVDKISKDINYPVVTGVAVPIAHGRLALSNFIREKPDTVIINADKSLTFKYGIDSLASFKSDTMYFSASQNLISKSFKLGTVSIGDVSTTTRISLEQMASGMSPAASSNIKLLDGKSAVFPSVSSQSATEYPTPSPSNFENVTCSSGNLELVLTNNLPTTMTNVVLRIKKDDNGTISNIGTATFSNVVPGASQTKTISLAGQTITNVLRMELVSFIISSTSTPVPINLKDDLKIDMNLKNIVIAGGRAQLPDQVFEQIDDTINYAVDFNERIESVGLRGGHFVYDVTNAIDAPVTLEIAFVATKNGDPFKFSIPLQAKQQRRDSMDLNGVTFDLSDPADRIPNKDYNIISMSYKLNVDSKSQAINISQNDEFKIDFSMKRLKFDFIEGYFLGRKVIAYPSDTLDFPLPAFGNIEGGLKFNDPKLSILVTSGVGVPLAAHLSLNGTSALKQSKLISDTIHLSKASTVGQVTTSTLVLNKNNSTIVDFLAIAPRTIWGVGTMITNPDGYNPASGKKQNWLKFGGALTVGFRAEVLVQIQTDKLAFIDTMEVPNFEDTPILRGVDEVEVALYTKTTFPFDMKLTIKMLDTISGKVIDSIKPNNADAFLIKTGTVDANGRVTAPVEFTSKILVSQAQYANLRKAQKIIYRIEAITAENGSKPVKIFTDNYFEIKLGAYALAHLNPADFLKEDTTKAGQ